MTFRLEECPKTFTSEDRLCRACKHPTTTRWVLAAVGTDYSFASCDTPKCQEIVRTKLQEAMAKSKVPA